MMNISSGLGYELSFTFETGIRKTIEWHLDHEVWWTSILESNASN